MPVNYEVVQLRLKRTLLYWKTHQYDQWAIFRFSFSVRHIFQFRSHRRNRHVIPRQHATFHRYRITRGGDNDVYRHTEYRQDISVHGRYITISVLQKQTSAVLKFFFRSWLWSHHRNPHEILNKISKLHPYRTTYCISMTRECNPGTRKPR